MQEVISASAIIDFDHSLVAAKAAALAKCCVEEIALARNCYYLVRDEIAHSGDIRSDLVTFSASEVLEAGYTLHGMNAVYLPQFGRYRCDARGNKLGINADFTPPVEHLAWSTYDTGECNFSGHYASPQPAVIKCLVENDSFQQVFDNLPDPTTLEP